MKAESFVEQKLSTVFVYGTLKRGYGNYMRLLEGHAEFVGEARTRPEFTMLHLGGFPGIIPNGETAISGEVFRVDPRVLARLDGLEGHPNFYRRTPIILESGEAVETYVLAHPDRYSREKVVEDGVWAGFNTKTKAS